MDFIQATYFTPGRQGATVDQIVMHWMDGTLAATIDTFTNGSRQASAHYGIGEGDEKQFVQEGDTAWADGDWNENIRSIAIEHSAQPGRDATDDTYARSIARVRLRSQSTRGDRSSSDTMPISCSVLDAPL